MPNTTIYINSRIFLFLSTILIYLSFTILFIFISEKVKFLLKGCSIEIKSSKFCVCDFINEREVISLGFT